VEPVATQVAPQCRLVICSKGVAATTSGLGFPAT